YTPPDIVEKLNKEINAVLADPAMEARIANFGYTAFASSSAEFGKFIAEDIQKWAKVVKFAGIKPQVKLNMFFHRKDWEESFPKFSSGDDQYRSWGRPAPLRPTSVVHLLGLVDLALSPAMFFVQLVIPNGLGKTDNDQGTGTFQVGFEYTNLDN